MTGNTFDPYWFQDPDLRAELQAAAEALSRQGAPRITVVTPAYKSGKYIRDTIRSIHAQFYPNLEYLVYDSCSEDGTAEILAEYDFLDATIEKDDGQADALSKGFARATGEILTWLNADDIFAPWALWRMAFAFQHSQADIIAGQAVLFSEAACLTRHTYGLPDGPLVERELLDLDGMWNTGQYFYQPEVFFRRESYDRAGGYVSKDLHYSMDYELWLRLAGAGAQIKGIGAPIVYFRKHEEQKTHAEDKFRAELREVVNTYTPRRQDPARFDGFVWGNRRPRIALINDHGFQYGAGIGHKRVAEALRLQYCDLHCFALADDVGKANLTKIRDYEELVFELEAFQPDAIIVGNLHSAERKHVWLSTLADRWPTFIFLHDFYMLTGRCGYPGACPKFLESSCDATCPTQSEYPQVAADRIAPLLSIKRRVTEHPNVRLLANSEYTAHVARSVLRARGLSETETLERVLITGLGVREDEFYALPRAARQAARDLLKLPKDRLIVLMPSGDYNAPRKGAPDAWALMEQLPPDRFHGLVVGNGKLPRGPVRDMITRFPYQKDAATLAGLFRLADFVLSASKDETFGQTIVEGALSGAVPVILRGGGALPELATHIQGSFCTTDRVPLDRAIAQTRAFLLSMADDPNALLARKTSARLTAQNTYSLAALSRNLHVALKQSGIIADRSVFPKVDLRMHTDTPPVKVLANQSIHT